MSGQSCMAPWCGIDGRYGNPGVCNAPGGHKYRGVEDQRAALDAKSTSELDASLGTSGGVDANKLMIQDLGLILRALDLGDHARAASPHDVVIAEVLPAIERLRKQLAEAWPDRPRLAGTVRIVREGPRQRIEVDGHRFPWDVALPVNVPVSRTDRPSVLLQLIAERIEVLDTIATPAAEDQERTDA